MTVNLIETLSKVPLFATLQPAELAELAKVTAQQSFAINEGIVVEDHPPPGLYVILDGKVAVMKKKNGGADHITDLDIGECVGELEIIDGSPCSASVVCYSDVHTAVVTKENLEAFFNANPLTAVKVLREMVRILSARLHQSNISYSSLMTIAEGVGDE